jgi:hypothetical protein
MVTVLIKLGVRLVVFTAVFWIAAQKNPKVVIRSKWVTPVVALVFSLLNTGLYWALKPILNLATFGAIGFAMPLVVNIVLLIATVRLFEKLKRAPKVDPSAKKGKGDKPAEAKPWLKIDGIITTLWMAIILTAAHGVLWFFVDYLPPRV